MDEGTTKATKVMARVMMIGFGVQIILGAAWACLQFPHLQEFGETRFLLKVQESLVCDEYVGILYPILLRIVLGIAKVIPIPYQCYLYALQLAFATWSARFFLKSFPRFGRMGKAFQCWAVLGMVTIPFAMQCHMAVLPNSLAGSLFLTHAGLAVRGFLSWNAPSGEKDERPALRIALMGACWLGEELLLPQWRILGGVLTAGYGIAEILHCKVGKDETKKELQKMIRIVVVTAVLLGMIPQISRLTTTKGAYGRMGDSPEAAAMRRYAWDDFGELFKYWPEELKTALTQEEIALCNEYPEQKLWILGQKIDGVYGREKAREIYQAVADAGRKVRAKRNLKEMVRDAAGYAFTPIAQVILMDGKGQKSYSASNYEIMRMHFPRLTSLYVRYGGWLFAFAACICLILFVGSLLKMDGKQRFRHLGNGLVFLVFGAFLILFYVLRGGGIMDPKNVLSVTLLWAAWACISASKGFSGAKK